MTFRRLKEIPFSHIFVPIFLISLFCIQIFVLYSKHTNATFPIPSLAYFYLNKHLKKHDLHLNAESLQLSLSGKITAKNLKVFLNTSPHHIFEVSQMHVKLNPFLFFFGSLKVSEINCKNATLLCPPTLSPSGLHQPIFQNIFLSIHSVQNRYDIKQAFATGSDAILSASGYWRFPNMESSSKNPINLAQLLLLCYHYYEQLSSAKLSRPFLHLTFTDAPSPSVTDLMAAQKKFHPYKFLQTKMSHAPPPPSTEVLPLSTAPPTPYALGTFAADAFDLSGLQLSTQNLIAHFNLAFKDPSSKYLQPPTSFTLLIQNPRCAHPDLSFTANYSIASALISPIAFDNFTTDFIQLPSLFFSELSLKNSFSLYSLFTQLNSYNKNSLNGIASFLDHNLQSIEANYIIDPSQEWLATFLPLPLTKQTQTPSYQPSSDNDNKTPIFNATITARTHIDHDFLVTLLPNWTFLHHFHFEKTPYTLLSLDFHNGFFPKNAELSLFTTSTAYEASPAPRTELTSAYVKCNVNQDTVFIPKLILTTPTVHVSGSYFHDLSTHDFRWLASGPIDPHLLTPWIPHWWQDLWNQFKLSPAIPPAANFDYQSNWTDSGSYLFYGYITSEKFSYRTVPVEKCNLLVYGIPTFLKIANINATTPSNEKLLGSIEWDYNPLNTGQKIKTALKATSTLPTDSLIAITQNQTVFDILSKFKCSVPPEISCEGVFYPTQASSDSFNAKFNTSSSLIYSGIPLDYLNFIANYTATRTTMNAIQYGFANGRGNAKAILAPQKDAPYSLSFETTLSKARLDPAIQLLKSFSHQPTPAAQEKLKGGLVDLNLSASGTLGNLNSFTGTGTCTISQSNLGDIYLFGILSRILDFTPLSLGTFHLTDAYTHFEIQKDSIYFPNLSVSGPTAFIQGDGRFFISNQHLDFNLEFSPLSITNIPIISQAFALFNPISKSVRIKLHGTLQNPEWDLTGPSDGANK